MKLFKCLLAAAGCTLLLAALVSSASAGRLSMSENSLRSTWTRWDFSGSPFGTVECELVLEETFHSRTMTKTLGTLIGYVTAANVTRCARGGATILRATLPWHLQYAGFTGALPNIGGIRAVVIGASFSIREPVFMATCLARSESGEPMGRTYNREAGGILTSQTASGSIRCRGAIEVTGGASGTSSSLTGGGGSRVILTLI